MCVGVCMYIYTYIYICWSGCVCIYIYIYLQFHNISVFTNCPMTGIQSHFKSCGGLKNST